MRHRGGASLNATVVVLGEIGRSPRMQYQARALAETGAAVTLVGYGGGDLAPGLADGSGVRVRALAAPWVERPRELPRAVYIVYSCGKVAWQAMALLAALLRGPRPDVLLVQSPPALPTIPVAILAARLRRSRLVIDWHNLGTPLVERTLGGQGALARLHAWAESAFGRRADAQLCVSRALQDALRERGMSAVVCRDRPADAFGPTLPERANAARRATGLPDVGAAVVVVAPTGWTEEEDTEMLLGAIDRAEAELRRQPSAAMPALAVVLTGRGPKRAAFERRLAERPSAHVAVRTAWLPPADYPVFLASCDVGLSLHRSFSGLDLAMKVEDLLGSGLPVLALDHGAVREQLPSGVGGWLFRDEQDLARALLTLAREGREGETMRRLRAEIGAAPRPRFGEEWAASARGLLVP
jgi:beta-1,4-mannosyltransferase